MGTWGSTPPICLVFVFSSVRGERGNPTRPPPQAEGSPGLVCTDLAGGRQGRGVHCGIISLIVQIRTLRWTVPLPQSSGEKGLSGGSKAVVTRWTVSVPFRPTPLAGRAGHLGAQGQVGLHLGLLRSWGRWGAASRGPTWWQSLRRGHGRCSCWEWLPRPGNEGWEEGVKDPKSQDAPLEVPTTSITGDRSCCPQKALALRLPCLAHLVSQPGGGRSCHLRAAQRRTLRRSTRRGRGGAALGSEPRS